MSDGRCGASARDVPGGDMRRLLLRTITRNIWLGLSVVTALPAGCGKSREGEQASRAEPTSTVAPAGDQAAPRAGPPRSPVAYGDLAEHAAPSAVEMVPRTPGAATMAPNTPTGTKARWPQEVATITDGRVLKIHCLPAGPLPPGLRPAPAGKRYLLLDVVAENLTGKGVDLQPTRRFRLQDDAGTVYEPIPGSFRLAFSPSRRSVVPARGARRVQLLYLVPGGQAMRLVYHGREKTESIGLHDVGSR